MAGADDLFRRVLCRGATPQAGGDWIAVAHEGGTIRATVLTTPVNDRQGRTTQVLTDFLWDWFDGGLLDGWR